MGKILLSISYGCSEQKAHAAPQERTARGFRSAGGEPSGYPHLPLLRAKIQIEQLGQPHVSALSGGAMAGLLTGSDRIAPNGRLPRRWAWLAVLLFSIAAWTIIFWSVS